MFCSVCLEDLETSAIKTLECSHSFHSYCINEWISHNTNCYMCPICRREYFIDNQVIIDIHENIEPTIQNSIEENYKVVRYTIVLLAFYFSIMIFNMFYIYR